MPRTPKSSPLLQRHQPPPESNISEDSNDDLNLTSSSGASDPELSFSPNTSPDSVSPVTRASERRSRNPGQIQRRPPLRRELLTPEPKADHSPGRMTGPPAPSPKELRTSSRSPARHSQNKSFEDDKPSPTSKSPPSSPHGGIYPSAELEEMKKYSSTSTTFTTTARPRAQPADLRQRMEVERESLRLTGPTRIQNLQSRPRKPEQPAFYTYLEIGMGVGAIFLLILWYMVTIREPSQEEMSTMDRFTKSLVKLETSFPEQDRHTWKVISASVKSIIREEFPEQPAVILLGTARGGRPLADCIARHLAKIVNQAFNSTNANTPLAIDVSSRYRSQDPGWAKMDMERKFEENFAEGSMSLNLLGLEDLDGTAAMLLHSYCDNGNAPHKRAVIVFTFEVREGEIPRRSSQEAERFLEESLGKVWEKKLGTDDTHALLSRVANSVVIVNQETGDTLSKKC